MTLTLMIKRTKRNLFQFVTFACVSFFQQHEAKMIYDAFCRDQFSLNIANKSLNIFCGECDKASYLFVTTKLMD